MAKYCNCLVCHCTGEWVAALRCSVLCYSTPVGQFYPEIQHGMRALLRDGLALHAFLVLSQPCILTEWASPRTLV
jgi:hypothetical protein